MDIRKFEQLFSQKMRSNKEKRLLAIEEYFADYHDIEVSFENDTDKCISFILQLIREDTEIKDSLLDEIADIVMQRFSIGIPFAVSELETKLDLNQIKTHIEELFLEECEYENLKFSDCDEVTVDEINETVAFKGRYKEFYIDPRTDELGREINSGVYNVTFDLKNKLFITSGVGYNKIVNKLIDLLKTNYYPDIHIKPYYVQTNIRYINNAATSNDFAPLTLLVINLIFKKLHEMGYLVQSVDSLSFNNESAPRIKNAKLTGTDLFKDPDVVERIYSEDKITKFTVNIIKMKDGKATLLTDLTIDFRGMIKFIFDNSKEASFTISQACVDLFKGINELIADEHTIDTGKTLIKLNMQRLAFNTRPQFNAFMYTLKNELVELLPDKEEEILKHFQTSYDIND